jgi:hypothetical protein
LLLFSGWGAKIWYRLRERPFFEKQASVIKGYLLMLRKSLAKSKGSEWGNQNNEISLNAMPLFVAP